MASPWEVEASSGGGNSEIPEPGNYPAVLVGLIDLGTHQEEYQGDKYDARKVLFAWELPSECDSTGSPFVLVRDYNFMHKISGKSQLRKLLEGWRGKPMADDERLDLSILLGKPCLINVGHKTSAKGNRYAVILGVTPPPRGMQVPRPFNQAVAWHFDEGTEFVAPDWLPYLYGKPVGDHIADSREAKGTPVGAAVGPAAGVNGAGPIDPDESPF